MKKKVYGLIGIAAVAAIGGTFAYYSATQTFNNPFDTTNFGTSTTEKFNPEDAKQWKPGTTVDKEVTATNTGDGPVWVRVKFDEEWIKKNAETSFIAWSSNEEGFFPTSTEFAGRGTYNGNDWSYHQIGEGENKEAKRKDGEKDGLVNKVTTENDKGDNGSVVFKKLENLAEVEPTTAVRKWYYNSDDGYFYFATPLTNKGDKTEKLLDSVTLCGNTDMGLFHDIDVWSVVEPNGPEPTYSSGETILSWPGELKDDLSNIQNSKWYQGTPSDAVLKVKDAYHYKADELDPIKQGYANANYTLNITVEYIQATEDGETSLPADSTWWYPGKSSATGGNQGGAGTGGEEGGNNNGGEETP